MIYDVLKSYLMLDSFLLFFYFYKDGIFFRSSFRYVRKTCKITVYVEIDISRHVDINIIHVIHTVPVKNLRSLVKMRKI